MNKEVPCKDCEDRTASCHAECEKYKTWRKKRDENRGETGATAEEQEMNLYRWDRISNRR